MGWQDVTSLVICAGALGWLVRRLLVTHGPPASKPDVTRASLVRKARAQKKQRARGDGACH
ncbi:hypothetical protein [Chondromyces apiculatus]|uniref:Uncharacterized protein n=1 Tax=Chondromyces apiculatus DSM 436 TaxID=1192034 RepID=A0A017SXW5_9BACT|nr:hypothetical protein [Chondromyces apiculatus]EYF01126.1 Hypothetical protein CAP_8631 [Chondromyces apiculatus DSM 436]